jgi:hypothetical protein
LSHSTSASISAAFSCKAWCLRTVLSTYFKPYQASTAIGPASRSVYCAHPACAVGKQTQRLDAALRRQREAVLCPGGHTQIVARTHPYGVFAPLGIKEAEQPGAIHDVAHLVVGMGVRAVKPCQCLLHARRVRVQHHQVHALVTMGNAHIDQPGAQRLHHRGLGAFIQRRLGQQGRQAGLGLQRPVLPLHPQGGDGAAQRSGSCQSCGNVRWFLHGLFSFLNNGSACRAGAARRLMWHKLYRARLRPPWRWMAIATSQRITHTRPRKKPQRHGAAAACVHDRPAHAPALCQITCG